MFDMFIGKLKHRMRTLHVGPHLDKVMDMGALVDPSHRKVIAKYVDEARQEGAEVRRVCVFLPNDAHGIKDNFPSAHEASLI